MNVLSLFDGCSMAMVALERAGIEVDNYFASEVDKFAISISKKNYPQIVQLGDINDWRKWDLPKIDLIIGGSPCQGFSFAGKQLNFDDPRSALFFKYVKIVDFYKPNYFLLENVKMKKEYSDWITKFMGVEPMEINSNLLSAQNRKRLYWFNWSVEVPVDRKISFDSIKEENPDTVATRSQISYATDAKYKSDRPTTMGNKVRTIRTSGRNLYIIDGKYRFLTDLEKERAQTLPDKYTEGVSRTQRQRMIGNGFTVDVIAHILKGIPNV